MDDAEHLIAMLDKSREMTRGLLRDLDAKTIIYSPWTLKHFLAHLAGWDDASTASLQSLAAGQEPATPAIRGIDYYNAESVSTRQELPYERIVVEWEQAREAFKAAIRALTPEQLSTPLLMPWARMGSAATIVHIMAEHEEEHATEIREQAEKK
jgi:hypothetical protein